MTWTELAQGKDLTVVPGWYSAEAEVKSSHTAADIKGLLAGKGFVIQDYQDNAALPGMTPAHGYRFVATIARATRGGDTIPWAAPWWLPGESSHLIRAWYMPAGSGPVTPPAPPSGSAWPWVLLIVGTGGLAAWWFRRKRWLGVR